MSNLIKFVSIDEENPNDKSNGTTAGVGLGLIAAGLFEVFSTTELNLSSTFCAAVIASGVVMVGISVYKFVKA